MFKLFNSSPVIPVPPSYDVCGDVDLNSTKKYLKYLLRNGGRIFMTTYGTSQFNLLSTKEIYKLNKLCASVIPEYAYFIMGLPPLSLTQLMDELRKINLTIDRKNTGIILFYPERYYDDNTIEVYFNSVASVSKFPIFIHGVTIKSGISGIYDFSSNLVNSLAQHPNIVGIKEENSTIDCAFNFCKNLNKDFITIVAGGSQRRYISLFCAGATTFLAGLGNVFPQLDIEFLNLVKVSDFNGARKIIEKYETPLFDVFMNIGWHKALREGLRQEGLCCFYDRFPFPRSSDEEKNRIKEILNYIRKNING